MRSVRARYIWLQKATKEKAGQLEAKPGATWFCTIHSTIYSTTHSTKQGYATQSEAESKTKTHGAQNRPKPLRPRAGQLDAYGQL
jgi:hypothetical protein